MHGELALSFAEVVTRLLVAAGLGAAIGLERERLEGPAGLRTHAMVAVTSALLAIVSAYGFADFLKSNPGASLDPSRIAAQIVTGVGFLGAGVIFLRNDSVHGLTTAASMWAVAGIGLAAGSGLVITASIATAILLFFQFVLRPVEKRFMHRTHTQDLHLRVEQKTAVLGAVREAIRSSGLRLKSMKLEASGDDGYDDLAISLQETDGSKAIALIDALRAIDGVDLVRWQSDASESGSVQQNPDKKRRLKVPGTPDRT